MSDAFVDVCKCAKLCLPMCMRQGDKQPHHIPSHIPLCQLGKVLDEVPALNKLENERRAVALMHAVEQRHDVAPGQVA